MNQFSDESDFITAGSRSIRLTSHSKLIDSLINVLIKFGILKEGFDYHLIRAAMVIIFVFFKYQKWWEYEAQVLIPYISNGPLICWLYPVSASAAPVGI